ncbi:hypothetical protein FOL46_003004, partial [Perkinsus olseni]
MTESSNPRGGEVDDSTAPSPATPPQVAHLHNAAKNPKTLPRDARISQTLTAAETHGDKLAAWRAGQLQRIRDIANSKDAKARDAELKARSPPEAENEERAKRLEGPYTEADLNKRFNGRWVFSPRFGKVESDKTRQIDDLTISRVNGLTRIGERIVLDTVDSALDLLQQQKDNDKAKGRHRQYRLFKGDHQSAYRQCPINPDDYDVAVVGIYHPDRADLVYYIHHSLPFGSKASCLHYTRVAKGICAILWYWLLL